MASDYQMLRKGMNSFSDYMRLEDEFRMKKEQAARQAQMDALTMQKAQKEIETGAASNDPAALRLANEYEAAIKSGDTDRANRIAAFSKIYDKNVMQTPDGQYVPLPGLPQALGNLKYGENLGGETATQQVRSAYEPGRAEDIATREMGVQLGNAAELERQKSLGGKMGSLLGDQMGEFAGNEKVLPIVRSLRVMNENSPTIPYAGKTQWARRLYPGTSKAEAAVDLMKQARIEIAAPLAKQLGVNPTDRDFLASLDRIFDIEATKESRERQINALEQRLLGRQMQLSERIGIPPMDASMLDAQIPALPVPTPPTPNVPQKGDVLDGYMFLGGDPGNEKSWKKVR